MKLRAVLFAALLALAPLEAEAQFLPLVQNAGQTQQLPSANALLTRAPTTANASLNLPHGTAPTSPNNGDAWTTTTGLFAQINGSTVGPFLGPLTGDATTSGSTLTLATVNSNVGTFQGITVNGKGLVTAAAAGTVAVGTSPLLETLPNGATGTVANKLVIYDNTAKVDVALTTSTTNVVGVCVNGAVPGDTCGTSGNSAVAIVGQVSCVFDGGTTGGDFVVASTTSGGDCHDTGSAVNPPTGVQIFGTVLTSNVGAGTYAIDLNPVGITGGNSQSVSVNVNCNNKGTTFVCAVASAGIMASYGGL